MIAPLLAPWGKTLPPHLRLRRAALKDRDFLVAVFCDGRAAEGRASGATPTMWAAFIADQFDLRVKHYARAFPGADRLIVEATRQGAGRAPVGTLTLAREGDAMRIVDIGLVAAVQGAGFGTALIRDIAETARRRGYHELALSVQAINPAAERLYTRLGFVATQEALHHDSGIAYREMRLALSDASPRMAVR